MRRIPAAALTIEILGIRAYWKPAFPRGYTWEGQAFFVVKKKARDAAENPEAIEKQKAKIQRLFAEFDLAGRGQAGWKRAVRLIRSELDAEHWEQLMDGLNSVGASAEQTESIVPSSGDLIRIETEPPTGSGRDLNGNVTINGERVPWTDKNEGWPNKSFRLVRAFEGEHREPRTRSVEEILGLNSGPLKRKPTPRQIQDFLKDIRQPIREANIRLEQCECGWRLSKERGRPEVTLLPQASVIPA